MAPGTKSQVTPKPAVGVVEDVPFACHEAGLSVASLYVSTHLDQMLPV